MVIGTAGKDRKNKHVQLQSSVQKSPVMRKKIKSQRKNEPGRYYT